MNSCSVPHQRWLAGHGARELTADFNCQHRSSRGKSDVGNKDQRRRECFSDRTSRTKSEIRLVRDAAPCEDARRSVLNLQHWA